MQSVIITDEEAASFKNWLFYKPQFDILHASGVFDLKNGSAEVHFDNEGKIALINVHLAAFRRMKIQLSTPQVSTKVASSDTRPHNAGK